MNLKADHDRPRSWNAGRIICGTGGTVMALASALPWTRPLFAWQVPESGLELQGRYTLAIGVLVVLLSVFSRPRVLVPLTKLGTIASSILAMVDVNLVPAPEAHPPLPASACT